MNHHEALKALKAADPKRNYSAGQYGPEEFVVVFWSGVKTRSTQEFRAPSYLEAVNRALDALGKPKVAEPPPSA